MISAQCSECQSEEICPGEGNGGSNSDSAFQLDDLSCQLDRSSKFVGLHFFLNSVATFAVLLGISGSFHVAVLV